jgi:hypothetical protein
VSDCIRGCHNVTDNGIVAVVEACKMLEYVDISGNFRCFLVFKVSK